MRGNKVRTISPNKINEKRFILFNIDAEGCKKLTLADGREAIYVSKKICDEIISSLPESWMRSSFCAV